MKKLEKGKKPKNITKDIALGFLGKKEFRKKFYKHWFKNWGKLRNTFLEEDMELTDNDYNKSAEFFMIRKSFEKVLGPCTISPETAAWVYVKYKKKYLKYHFKKIHKAGGRTPHLGKTEALKAFLDRGFVYMGEFIPKPGDYTITCHLADLIYPKTFEHHQDAIGFMGKIGIPGYTECPIPKSK